MRRENAPAIILCVLATVAIAGGLALALSPAVGLIVGGVVLFFIGASLFSGNDGESAPGQ